MKYTPSIKSDKSYVIDKCIEILNNNFDEITFEQFSDIYSLYSKLSKKITGKKASSI